MKKGILLFSLSVAFLFFLSHTTFAQICNCKYTIPLSQEIIDGSKLNLAPGDVICIQAGVRRSLWFENFQGTAAQPLIIKNCGGQVIITNTIRWGVLFYNSKYFKFLGNGDPSFKYGIKIDGVATVGVSFRNKSTDFEVAHIEVNKSLGPGIMAKTDPECDKPDTWRGNFVMRNVNIHDLYIHDVGSVGGGGEGFYIGHSFWGGIDRPCGKIYPHTIENIKIHHNRVENTVFDGMQVSCAVSGVEVFNNTITNFGTINNGGQQSGLVIGGGSKGRYYNNKINKGTGMGVCVFGQGDVHFYNNVVSNTGLEGVFIDDRSTDPNLGFYFYNNTVVNSKSTGMLTYNAKAKINVFYNNLIVNPNNWPRSYIWQKAFIYLENIPTINKVVKYDTANNYFVKDIASAQFINSTIYDFHLKSTSRAIDRGKDLTTLGINFDVDNLKRPSGKAFDIGAHEFGGTVTTPIPNTTTLAVTTTSTSALCYGAANGKASATVSGGTSPYTYAWSNGKTTQSIDLLAAGSYTVTVTDSKGIKGTSTIAVRQAPSINITNTKIDATSSTKGSINITVSGGTAPFTFAWSNGAITEDISNLSPGTYTVTVKDKNACIKTASVTINLVATPSGQFSGVYNIISKQTGKYLGVVNSSTSDNANIKISNNTNIASQRFKIEPTTDGYYRITATHSNKALDVTGISDGSNVIQSAPSSSDDCQKFKITDVGGGYYKIIPKCTGRGFEVKDGSKTDGALVVLWTYWGGDYQKWKLQTVASQKFTNIVEEDQPELKDESSKSLKVFPNPVTGDQLNISLYSDIQTEAKITILNSMSLPVVNLTRSLKPGVNSLEISTHPMKGGVHLLIVNKGPSRMVKKIIILK